MKIQDDLVWNKNTGELIGFVDLGDIDLNYATLQKSDNLASHVLVFLIKSVLNPLSFAFATFATEGIKSFQLFPLFWKAVAILEITCNLKVIAAVSDGASPNRSFYKMHYSLNDNIESVTYKTPNIFSSEKRGLCFFSDPPHLIKTTRNCLSNSGSYRCTRYMWNNGIVILWSHVAQMYNADSEDNLQYFPRLNQDHINLTPYSVMNVRLAAQVLSETVGNILKEFGSADATETSELILKMDKCLTAVMFGIQKSSKQP